MWYYVSVISQTGEKQYSWWKLDKMESIPHTKTFMRV